MNAVFAHMIDYMKPVATIQYLVNAMIGVSRDHGRMVAATWPLRRIVRLYWLPTLDNLRTAHQSSARSGRDELNSLDSGIRIWFELGHAFWLVEDTERSRQAEGVYQDNIPRPFTETLLGCYAPDCPCYGRKALHGHMRVCKGCWRAKYCGPRCQRRWAC